VKSRSKPVGMAKVGLVRRFAKFRFFMAVHQRQYALGTV
jgi:hypothetical protein